MNGKSIFIRFGDFFVAMVKGFTWKNWQVHKGIGSAKIWATLDKGTFQKVQSTFQLYGLNLTSRIDKSVREINRLSGNIGWKQDEKGQLIIAGDDLLIGFPIMSFGQYVKIFIFHFTRACAP